VACLSDWLGRRASFGEPHCAGVRPFFRLRSKSGLTETRRIVARYGGFRDNGRIASQVCFDLR
jgi:hypothetical protein